MPVELDDLAGPKGGDEGRRLAQHWLDELTSVKDDTDIKRWVKRGEAVEKRYRSESTQAVGARRYNALWSNVEILKPALYGKMPLPVAERRFKDRDPVGRAASTMLERGLRNEIEICGFDEAMSQAVGDYLLPGRGTVWVRYEPLIEESVSLSPETQTDMRDSQGPIDVTPKGRMRPRLVEGNEESAGEEVTDLSGQKLRQTGDRIIRESTPVDFVAWTDFFTLPKRARVWSEVTAVAKLVYMSRDQMVRRFGKTIGKAIPLEKDSRGKAQSQALRSLDEDKGKIYEIWSAPEQAVYWVANGYEFLCDRKDDPLKLENFFPCPRPLYANATNNTLVPVPDYIQYQDQAIQIDELTQRIAMLTKALKWAGVYNAAAKDIQRLFNESLENELIPVDDWAAFADKGGVEGNMSLLPIKDAIGIIEELMKVKAQQVEEMDRLTGITDIMRGTTDARETLGGQRLKSNSSGTRLTKRQNEVARFARDTVRIIAEIMCEHFSPRSLIEASGALYDQGLGSEDMPDLSDMQSGIPAPPQGPPSGPPPMPMGPQGAPPQPPPMLNAPAGPQTAPGPPPMGPPPGSNIVPFKPPGPPGMPVPQGAPAPPPGPPPELLKKLKSIKLIADAITLLRNERLRGFRVDIEVDSTIYSDQAQDKDDRTQFVKATTDFLQVAMMLGASMPESIPLLGKLLQFGVRGHRVGRDLELAVEEFTDEAAIVAKRKQANPDPNPEMLKLQIEQAKAQATIANQQQQSQIAQQKASTDMQSAQMKAMADSKQADADIERQRLENEGEQFNSAADMRIRHADIEIKLIDKRMEEMRMQVELLKMKQLQEQMDMEAQQARVEMVHERAQMDMEGEQSRLEMKHEAAQSRREEKHSKVEMEHEKEILKAKTAAEKAKANAAAKKARASTTK